MKKSSKINGLIIMALVACFSIMLGLVLFLNPSSSKARATEPTITMLDADIRLESDDPRINGDTGLRFNFKIDKDTYAALLGNSNAEVGVLIYPTDKLNGENLTVDKVSPSGAIKALSPLGVGDWREDNDGWVSCAYLKNIPAASFNRPITARAFVDWKNGSVYYADQISVSIADLALTQRATDMEADQYVLDYAITFEGVTTSVEYGSEFEVPSDPVKAGYVFNGWQEKTGEDTYASIAEITDKVVKYNRTYKANYSLLTVQKPELEKKLYDEPQDYDFSDNNGTQIWAEKSATYFFKDVELAQDQDFVIYATVTGSSADPHADHIGFVVGTLATDANHIRFEWRSDDIYIWREGAYGWVGHADHSFTPGYGDKTSDKEIALVYHKGFYYMFLNGNQVLSVSQDGFGFSGDGNWSGTITPKDYIGTEGTKKIGISGLAGRLYCSDWGYSIDATVISNYLKFEYRSNAKAKVVLQDDLKLTVNGSGVLEAYFAGVEIEQNQDFVIYTKVRSGFKGDIGFVVGTLKENGNNLMFQWRSNDIYISRDIGGYVGHENNIITPGYGNNSSDKTMALVYKNKRYYMYLNDIKVWEASEDGFDNGWGGNVVPKNIIGTEGTKKIGFSAGYTASMICYDYGYSTDADVIAEFMPTPISDVANGIYANGVNESFFVNGKYKIKGAYLINGSQVQEQTNYVLSATFTMSEASEIGFVITTNNNWDGDVKNLMFVYRKAVTEGENQHPADIYLWGNNIWHVVGKVTDAPEVGEEMKLQVVYKGNIYYVFINGDYACEVYEEATYKDGKSPKTALGSGDVYFGLVSMNAVTTFTNFKCFTAEDEIGSFGELPKFISNCPNVGDTLYGNGSAEVAGDVLTVNNSVNLFDTAKIYGGTNFVIIMMLTDTDADEIGFVITDKDDWNGELNSCMFVYRRSDSKIHLRTKTIDLPISDEITLPPIGEGLGISIFYYYGKYYIQIGTDNICIYDGEVQPINGNIYLGVASLGGESRFNDWNWYIDETMIDTINTFYSSVS